MNPLSTLSYNDIWQKAKSELKVYLPSDAFESWFENIDCLGGKDNKLLLGTPSALAPYWISDNYWDVLTRNVSMAAGCNVDVEIQIIEDEDAIKATIVERENAEVARRKTESAARAIPPSINPQNTFESFVVGESNKFAHAAALAVAEKPGVAFNPLFIHGATGLGKTHLMHAISHFILKNYPNKNIVYLSSENFASEYINALSNKDIYAFRRKYRNADVILIDDVQFFARKEACQEEFFHTFNELFNAQKQIILSCDKPISEVADIEQRLVSRFGWGVSVDIQTPDYETRFAILQKKVGALKGSVNITNDVIDLVARRFTKNVRRMEGAINKLIGYATLIKDENVITLEKAQYLLADAFMQEEDNKVVDIEQIQKKVAEYYKIDVAEMCGNRRPANIALARQIAMYISRKLTTHSLQEIGRRFGNRDHGTVMYAIRVVDNAIEKEESIKRSVEYLKKILSV